MSEFFLKIVNMSISASWLVLAVLLLRLILKKAPKWASVLLWGLVAVRLICPFSFESVMSLIPSAETISPYIMVDPRPEIHTGISLVNSVINPIVLESFAPDPGASMNPLQLWIPLAAFVWIIGVAAMLMYTAVSYILLQRKVATAIRLRSNIYQSENVDSPFVLGIINPKIYLPFNIERQIVEYVITHEDSHIRRKDHWWKPLGFVLLALHWFNPLMWIGYILLCRDIELACDEKVIMEMDNENRADYTQALVACSVSRRSIAACPIAFGEVSVRERVKSVMNHKKPSFWVICAAVVVCVVVAVCFLTNPAETKDPNIVNVIKTDLNTYYELSDGTWRANGRVYQHRLIISGRMHNAVEDSTFVYLSNLEDITFDQAWKAAGFSSNTADYIPAENAILVDRYTGSTSASLTGSSKTESTEQISGTKIFVYEGVGFGGGNFHIKIHDDGTFTYQQGSASNYYGVGKWSLQGDVLCMKDDISSYTFVNYFKVVENTLVFQAENSTNFMYVHLSDGEKFINTDV